MTISGGSRLSTQASRSAVFAVAALSQVGWFAAVLGAAHGWAHAGPVAAVLILPVSGLLLGRPGRVLALAGVGVLIGFAVETALMVAGLVRYAAPGPWPMWPPLWLLSLWALFALVIETALTALDGRRLAQASIAAIGGPLAYLAGEKLQAMEFQEPRWLGISVLACAWAVALPLLMESRRVITRCRSPRP